MRKVCIDSGLVYNCGRPEGGDRHCPQKPRTSCFKNSSSPLERGKTRDYNKIKGRSFSTSFDTLGRVGCAETRASGEAQESGEVGKAGAYEEVTVSFCPARCGQPAGLASALCHAGGCDFNLPSCAMIPAACRAHVLRACHAVTGYPC